MHVRTLTLIAVLLAFLTGSAGLSAEGPTPARPRPDEPRAREKTIEERLDVLEAQTQVMKEEIDLIRRHVVITRTSGSSSSAPDTASGQSAAQERFDRLENTTRGLYDRLEQIGRQLEEAKPRPQPNMSVVASTTTQGRLALQNWTKFSQYLSVNGTVYVVQPGRTDIMVPWQPVEAYIPGRELPKLLGMSFWRWTGREYEMPLEIKN